MSELKEKALAKMLQEMKQKHSPSIDKIHNWLCDQSDEALMQNILKEGKTIAGAYSLAKSKAQKEAQDGCAVIDDDVVFGWVVDYFTSAAIEAPAKVVRPSTPVQADDDESEEVAPIKVKKISKKDLLAAEATAKQKAIADAAEAARKASHAPNNQTSIFDFGA